MPKSFSEQERKIIRQSMIDITASLMKAKGIRQITVDEIARGANISKGSFYSFYNAREELFWDIIKTQERDLIDEIIDISKQTGDIRTKIRHILYDVFLRKNWLIYFLPESDFQYITRKLPPELLEADRDQAFASVRTILSLSRLEDSPANIELLLTMMQILRLTETNFIYQSQQNKQNVQHILVEGIVDYLCNADTKQ